MLTRSIVTACDLLHVNSSFYEQSAVSLQGWQSVCKSGVAMAEYEEEDLVVDEEVSRGPYDITFTAKDKENKDVTAKVGEGARGRGLSGAGAVSCLPVCVSRRATTCL